LIILICLSVTIKPMNDWFGSHVTLEVDRGMSWDQATSRLDSNPGHLNGFYVSRRDSQLAGRRWFVLATLKDASTHVFRVARLETFNTAIVFKPIVNT